MSLSQNIPSVTLDGKRKILNIDEYTKTVADQITGGGERSNGIFNDLRQIFYGYKPAGFLNEILPGIDARSYEEVKRAAELYGEYFRSPQSALNIEYQRIAKQPVETMAKQDLEDMRQDVQAIADIGKVSFPTSPTGMDRGIVDISGMVDPELLSAIGQIQKAGEVEEGRQGDITELEASLPSELARGREEFATGLREQGSEEFNRITPEIMQQLNVRGALQSGDLATEFARGAGNIQAGVEEEIGGLTYEDEMFITNAAYQNTLRKELSAVEDLGKAISGKRTSTLEDQETRFQNAQAELTRKFNESAEQRRVATQLSAQEQALKREKEQSEKASKMQLIGDIGSTVGTIAGAGIGSSIAKGVTT